MDSGHSAEHGVQLEPVQSSAGATRTSTPKSGRSDSRAGSGLADFQDGQGSLDISPFGTRSVGKGQTPDISAFLPQARLTPSFSAKTPFSALGRSRKERRADEYEALSLSANPAPYPRTSSLAVDIPRSLSFFVSPIRRSGKRLHTTGRIANPVFDAMSPGEVFELPGSDGKRAKRDLSFSGLLVKDVEEENLSKSFQARDAGCVHVEKQAKLSPADIFWDAEPSAKNGKGFALKSSTNSRINDVIPDEVFQSETADSNDVRSSYFAYADENDVVFTSPHRPVTSYATDDLSRFPDEQYYLCKPERRSKVYDDDDDEDDDVSAAMRSSSFSDVIFAEEEGVERNSLAIGIHEEDFDDFFAAKKDRKRKQRWLGEERGRNEGEGKRSEGEGERGEGERGEGDGEDQCEFCGQWFKDGSSLLHHYASSNVTRCSCSHLDSLGGLSPRQQVKRKLYRSCENNGEDSKTNNVSSASNGKSNQATPRQEDQTGIIQDQRGSLPSYIVVQDELGNVRLPFSMSMAQKIRELLFNAKETEEPVPEPRNTVDEESQGATCQVRGEAGLPDEGIDENLFDVFPSAGPRLEAPMQPQQLQIHPRRRHRWKSDEGVVSRRRVDLSAPFSQSEAPDESWYSFLHEHSKLDGNCENAQKRRPPLAQMGAKSKSFSNRGGSDLLSRNTSAFPLRRSVSVQASEDAMWDEWAELQGEEAESSYANQEFVENPRLSSMTEKQKSIRHPSQTSIKSSSALPKTRPLSPRDRAMWAGPDVPANQRGEPPVGGVKRLAKVTPLKVLPTEAEEDGSLDVQEEMGRIIRDLERNGRRNGVTSLVRRIARRERSTGGLPLVSENVRDDVTDERLLSNDVINGSRGDNSNNSRQSRESGDYPPCSRNLGGADNPILWRSRVGEFAKGDNYCCIFCRREFVSPQEFIGHFTAGRSDSCSHSLSDFLHLLQVPSLPRPDWWHCQCVLL